MKPTLRWANLDEALFAKLAPQVGERFRVMIARAGQRVFEGERPYARTFGDVPEGTPLLFMNSLMNVGFAINGGDFARTHRIGRGAQWTVRLAKARR